MDLIVEQGGLILAVIGMALAVIIPGISSGKGVGMVGEAAAGIIIEEPQKFGKSLLLQLMPASQGLYGFVIAILVMSRLSVDLSLQEGFYILVACLPIAIVGGPTALAQARVAISGLTVLSKNESQSTKSVIYAVMVETYALLAFVMSLIILNQTVGF